MSNEQWQAYTMDTSPDQVRTLFERKYGHPPVEVRDAGPIRLAGPIGEHEPRQMTLLEATQCR